MTHASCLIAGILSAWLAGCSDRDSDLSDAPYPASSLVRGIVWDTSTALPRGQGNPAFGSDQWRTTWADDGNLYSAWGDGGGFGGTNTSGRVSMGVARITGTPPDWKGINVWGGLNAYSVTPAIEGKPAGLIGTNGVIYVWALKQDTWDMTRIARSVDNGKTWRVGDFVLKGTLKDFGPIQFGRGYAGVPQDLAGYVYGLVWKKEGESLSLARVPTNEIENASAYSFFAGLDGKGKPLWSTDADARKPVFIDAVNGINWGAMAAYNPHLEKYFLSTTHGRHPGSSDGGEGPGLGIFVADDPWGPWKTAYFSHHWLDGFAKFTIQLIPKWMSSDGTGWIIHGGWPEYDGYFHLRYTLDLGVRSEPDGAG
jgi:hypothetical protein